MATTLACWNDEEVFLPWTANEETEEKWRKQYGFVESKEDMIEWLDAAEKSGKPYLVYGITIFDKYGGLVLHTEEDLGCQVGSDEWFDKLDGAMMIDYARFCKYINSNLSLTEKILDKMKRVLLEDFAVLNAWSHGSVFSVVKEARCPTCGQWREENEDEDSICGFYLTDLDSEKEMFDAMLCNFDCSSPDMTKIKSRMLTAA